MNSVLIQMIEERRFFLNKELQRYADVEVTGDLMLALLLIEQTEQDLAHFQSQIIRLERELAETKRKVAANE